MENGFEFYEKRSRSIVSRTVSMISRILYPKLKYIRNFPLYNCLQSKSNS